MVSFLCSRRRHDGGEDDVARVSLTNVVSTAPSSHSASAQLGSLFDCTTDAMPLPPLITGMNRCSTSHLYWRFASCARAGLTTLAGPDVRRSFPRSPRLRRVLVLAVVHGVEVPIEQGVVPTRPAVDHVLDIVGGGDGVVSLARLDGVFARRVVGVVLRVDRVVAPSRDQQVGAAVGGQEVIAPAPGDAVVTVQPGVGS
jgi:hypothetical protein